MRGPWNQGADWDFVSDREKQCAVDGGSGEAEVSLPADDIEKANSLTTGISIQDVPEGLVVALALRTVGYGRLMSVSGGVVSGLIEPVAAAFGVALIGISAGLLPFALAAAGGAMLLVIVHDVIPESHRGGNATAASIALVGGFILMTVLDTALS